MVDVSSVVRSCYSVHHLVRSEGGAVMLWLIAAALILVPFIVGICVGFRYCAWLVCKKLTAAELSIVSAAFARKYVERGK